MTEIFVPLTFPIQSPMVTTSHFVSVSLQHSSIFKAEFRYKDIAESSFVIWHIVNAKQVNVK